MEKPATHHAQPSTPLTTFVQADTNTFRELVQKLTGATDEELQPAAAAAAAASSPSLSSDAVDVGGAQNMTAAQKPMGVKRPTFKLHERRQYSRPKLEIIKPSFHHYLKPGQQPVVHSPGCLLSPTTTITAASSFPTTPAVLSPSSSTTTGYNTSTSSPLNSPCMSFSNLSILDRGSKDFLDLNSEEEERAIKERRFYLHPSPRSRPGDAEPELLPLFPLTSPRTRTHEY